MSERYNGWKNYATWLVNIEILDGIDWSEEFDLKPGVLELASHLDNYVDEVVSGFGNPEIVNSLAYSYAQKFLADVSYYELAEHILDDYFANYCSECDYGFDEDTLRPWKYEPGSKLCDDCYSEKLREEESDKEGNDDASDD